MGRRTAHALPARAGLALVLGGALALGACSTTPPPGASPAPSAAPAPTPTIDPAVRAYCDAVRTVQAEQASPEAGQGGLPAASAAARRQIGSLVATAPPEIAGDWRVLQGLTDRALGTLAATGGDPQRIDRRALDAISRQSQPTVARIKTVTQQRCGVNFAPGPAAAPAPAPTPSSSRSTSTSSSTSTRSPRSSSSSGSGDG